MLWTEADGNSMLEDWIKVRQGSATWTSEIEIAGRDPNPDGKGMVEGLDQA